jgi:hypothetical protein
MTPVLPYKLESVRQTRLLNIGYHASHFSCAAMFCYGLLLLTANVLPIGELTESFGISLHQFADDTQLYVACSAANIASDIYCLTNYSQAC